MKQWMKLIKKQKTTNPIDKSARTEDQRKTQKIKLPSLVISEQFIHTQNQNQLQFNQRSFGAFVIHHISVQKINHKQKPFCNWN